MIRAASIQKPTQWAPGRNIRQWDLWRGCRFCLPLWEGAAYNAFDIAPQRIGGTPGNTTGISWAASPYGQAMEFDGTYDPYIDYGSELTDIPLSDFTIVTLCRRDGNSGAVPVCSFTGTDDLLVYPNDPNTGSGGLRLFWRDRGTNPIDENGIDYDGVWQHLSVVRRGGQIEAWRDGVQFADESLSAGTEGPFSTFYLAGYEATTQNFNGGVAFFAMWDRALSGYELQALAADPFCMLRMERPPVPVFATSAGTTYVTMTGSSAATSAATGAIKLTMELTGSSAAAAATTGALGLTLGMTGASAASAGTSATLKRDRGLTGSSAGLSALSGSLHATLGLSGTSAGAGGASALLSRVLALTGQTDGTAGATGTLGLANVIQLTGSIAAAAALTGSLRLWGYDAVTATSPTWTPVDSDADTIAGPMDWDASGQIKRRFDEPDTDWSERSDPSTTWSET